MQAVRPCCFIKGKPDLHAVILQLRSWDIKPHTVMWLSQAVDLDPEYAKARQRRADAFVAMGDFSSAAQVTMT